MANECIFECELEENLLATAGPARVKTIILASKQRGDDKHIQLQQQLDDNENLSIKCHRSCVSTYTSTSHIQRQLK